MLKQIFVSLQNNKSGATAIEYALIASLIAVVAIGALKILGPKIGTTMNNVANSMES